MKKLFRSLFTVLHLALLMVLLAMFGNVFISPSQLKWLNFISLAFPVLITIYVFLTVIWIVSWRKRAILFLIGLLFFFNPIRRWINYSSSSEGNFKMVSFNVHSGREIPELKTFLEKENPDLVFLQETGNHIERKMKLANLPYVYEKQVVAIYSKYPIQGKGEIINDDTNGHAIYADIEINGETLRLFNVYLEPFYLEKSMIKPTESKWENERKAKYLKNRMTESFKIHAEQVNQITQVIKSSPHPIILAGDFNSVPNSYEYYHLAKGLQDGFTLVGNGSSTSFHEYKFPLRIDYIFTSPPLKPASYKVDRTVDFSDHFPVIGTYLLK